MSSLRGASVSVRFGGGAKAEEEEEEAEEEEAEERAPMELSFEAAAAAKAAGETSRGMEERAEVDMMEPAVLGKAKGFGAGP